MKVGYETAESVAKQAENLTAKQLEDIIPNKRFEAFMKDEDPHKYLCKFWKQIHILRSKK